MASSFDDIFFPRRASSRQDIDPLSAFLETYDPSVPVHSNKPSAPPTTPDANIYDYTVIKQENLQSFQNEESTSKESCMHEGSSIDYELQECANDTPVVDNKQGIIDNVEALESSNDEIAGNADGVQINVVISNVVCNFATRCHLNLRRIATEGANVVYKRENNVVNMKLRKPGCTANIWSSGKITCTGTSSEEDSKVGARKTARCLQKLGFPVKFTDFRIVNVLGSCSLPFAIKLAEFAREHPRDTSYEPELHPGATYKVKEPKATLKVFSTGSITVTAPRVANVQAAIEHIFPLVSKHSIPKALLDPRIIQEKLYYECGTSLEYRVQSYKYKRRDPVVNSDDEESFGVESDSSQD